MAEVEKSDIEILKKSYKNLENEAKMLRAINERAESDVVKLSRENMKLKEKIRDYEDYILMQIRNSVRGEASEGKGD